MTFDFRRCRSTGLSAYPSLCVLPVCRSMTLPSSVSSLAEVSPSSVYLWPVTCLLIPCTPATCKERGAQVQHPLPHPQPGPCGRCPPWVAGTPNLPHQAAARLGSGHSPLASCVLPWGQVWASGPVASNKGTNPTQGLPLTTSSPPKAPSPCS